VSKALVRILAGIAAVAAVAVVGFLVVEKADRAGIKKDAGRGCGGLDTATPGATLPPALDLPSGQKLLRVQEQGRTTVAVASAEGTRDDIVLVRDGIASALRGQGFTIPKTDQEPGFEAEAQLGGKATGSLRVKPLCTGRLEIRYTLAG
jgi:hypothetical protein